MALRLAHLCESEGESVRQSGRARKLESVREREGAREREGVRVRARERRAQHV